MWSSGFEPRSPWLLACQKHRFWVAFGALYQEQHWPLSPYRKKMCTAGHSMPPSGPRQDLPASQDGAALGCREAFWGSEPQEATRRKARSPGLEKRWEVVRTPSWGLFTARSIRGPSYGTMTRGRLDRWQATLQSFPAQLWSGLSLPAPGVVLSSWRAQRAEAAAPSRTACRGSFEPSAEPGWTGQLPAGMEALCCPSAKIWRLQLRCVWVGERAVGRAWGMMIQEPSWEEELCQIPSSLQPCTHVFSSRNLP